MLVRLGIPENDYSAIVAVLADLLNQHGAIYDWVESNGKDTEEPVVWDRICTAAAWVVVDRYEQAVKGGKWVPEP